MVLSSNERALMGVKERAVKTLQIS